MPEEEILQLIFEPGFSNAEKITEVSGRGVGMDVVKRAVESIGGRVNIKSKVGQGTTIELALPSSMAVKGALLFMLNKQEYAIPLTFTEGVVSIFKKNIHKISNGLMTTYLGKTIPIIFLKDIFNSTNLEDITSDNYLHKTYRSLDDSKQLHVMVVSYNNKLMGLVVDKLLQQKEIVEKTLAKPLDGLPVFSGATILGSGNVCLVLDISNILRTYFNEQQL